MSLSNGWSAGIRRELCTVIVPLVLLTLAPTARAALGDDVSAIENDRIRMRASLRVQKFALHDVHEMTLAIGTKVREYVGKDGKVFAVAWSGGWRPNLRDIMGRHYDHFIANTRGRRRPRGAARIEIPGMVVVVGGYLRTSYGYTYLPDALPTGFSAQDIK
jgi:hypothetical protein